MSRTLRIIGIVSYHLGGSRITRGRAGTAAERVFKIVPQKGARSGKLRASSGEKSRSVQFWTTDTSGLGADFTDLRWGRHAQAYLNLTSAPDHNHSDVMSERNRDPPSSSIISSGLIGRTRVKLCRDGTSRTGVGKDEELTQVERKSWEIIDAANLPPVINVNGEPQPLTFASFGRHGGATESMGSGLTELELMKKGQWSSTKAMGNYLHGNDEGKRGAQLKRIARRGRSV
jgi:hypothetical protein